MASHAERIEDMDEQRKKLERKIMLEKRLEEARESLQDIFEGKTRLILTEAADSTPRVRAFIPDEDGYAGWLDGAMFVGASKVQHNGEDKYVVETHFPYGKDRRTYFWEFNPDNSELFVKITSGDVDGLDLFAAATDDEKGYFASQVSELARSYSFNDYEHRNYHNDYSFQLPQLT